MLYMRIPRNKFWGWVGVSLLAGLAIGLAIMLWRTASLGSEIKVLTNQVNSASAGASETVGSVEAQLVAAETSLTALTEQNSQLASDLADAKAEIKTLKNGPTASTTAIAVVSRTVSPSTVDESGTITLTVKVSGHPSSVTMRIYTTSKSFDKTYSLRRVSTSGNSETWRLTAKAGSRSGTYHYYATAIKGSTRVTMPGASPKSFTVH
jgi:hypothetical protein